MIINNLFLKSGANFAPDNFHIQVLCQDLVQVKNPIKAAFSSTFDFL